MFVYWSRCARNRNFGDVLGPYIVENVAQRRVEYAEPERAELVVVGSIVEYLPDSYGGAVAGIGCARASTRRSFVNADVKLVRGEHTARRLGVKVPVGDPGLLASDFIERQDKKYRFGFIRHYADKTNSFPAAHQINILWPIEKVIEETDKCDAIVTSSLHGLILADSLGIKRRWVLYPRVQGSGFKFKDYGSSIGERIVPDRWGSADPVLVEEKKAMMRNIFEGL
jgi:pyruvyltransferase